MSTLAYPRRVLEHSDRSSAIRLGIGTGLGLLTLPLVVVFSVRLAEPGTPALAHIVAAEACLVAAVQVAVSIRAARSPSAAGLVGVLIPALVAGLVVATGDIAGSSFAFHTRPADEILPVIAYDVLLGLALALPIIIVLRAGSRCRAAINKAEVDASPTALIGAYQNLLGDRRCRTPRWHVFALLAEQLLRRHVRRTLEAAQRGYARRAIERGLNETEVREREAIGDYLLSVPPMSKIVPIPTVASVFVLWKVVPFLVAMAAAIAAWFGGGHWGLANVSSSIDEVVPHEVATLLVDALALIVAFPILMLVLTPAIHRRDTLLADYEVCEREVILMDDNLRVPRSSRRLEYVLAAFPALPLTLYGAAVLAYALVGLFIYPSPKGPLGALVERGDLLHVGPVTGVFFAQVFLVTAAVWIAWVVKTRKTTRVVFL